MTSDGSEGLCNDVLLLEEFPVGCAGVRVAQGSDLFILVLNSFMSFFCHFYPLPLLTERKYV